MPEAYGPIVVEVRRGDKVLIRGEIGGMGNGYPNWLWSASPDGAIIDRWGSRVSRVRVEVDVNDKTQTFEQTYKEKEDERW